MDNGSVIEINFYHSDQYGSLLKMIDTTEERESLAISAAAAAAAAAGSNTKKVRQRAPRACLNCRDLKVSRNTKNY